MASRGGTVAPDLAPKHWEVRAALRVMARNGDAGGRNIAHDIVTAAWDMVSEGNHDFTVKQVSARRRSGAADLLPPFRKHSRGGTTLLRLCRAL